MTDGYLSKDRAYLAAMQRERRARIVRIDYMPSKAARDAIEAMRAHFRHCSVSATNSAVIDAIAGDWARLTGIQQDQVAKPVTPARFPVLSGQRAHKGSAAQGQPDASRARARVRGAFYTADHRHNDADSNMTDCPNQSTGTNLISETNK